MMYSKASANEFKRMLGIGLVVLSLGLNALAEETPIPANPVTPAPAPNTEQFYGNPTTIPTTVAEGAGREQKANEATNNGNSGQGAAIAAGSALMGASAAAFAAMNIPLGVTLATMGALEFAQAGADSESAGANNAQENILRAESGQTGQQAFNPSEAAAAIENTGISSVLSEIGVTNPEEFINEVANGNITSPEQVLSAIGQTGNFTSEEVAAMGNFSEAAEMAGIKYEEGNAAAAVLGMQESSNTVASASAKGIASNGETLSGGSGEGAAGGSGSSAHASNGGKNGGGASLGTDGEAAGTFGFGKPGTTGPGGVTSLANMDRSQLKKLGILKPHGKQTIFQIASRNYRSFQTWRRNKLRKSPVGNPSTQQVAKVGTIKLR